MSVVRITAVIKERALGAEVSRALNPGQQVVKIVDEELQASSAAKPAHQPGQDRPHRDHARGPAGRRQDHAPWRASWASGSRTRGAKPVLVASDLQRPTP
ncbi:hypothetical protein QJS66_01050 [Kocuria rhizophila]|nr:hypothetical protein QJS66_01050 [Kocuria rhizophila]